MGGLDLLTISPKLKKLKGLKLKKIKSYWVFRGNSQWERTDIRDGTSKICPCSNWHALRATRQNYERSEHWSHKSLKRFTLNASYLCDALKHKSMFQVPSEVGLIFILWTGSWYKRKHYCAHWKSHLSQRKKYFDHKSKVSEMKALGPTGRMKPAACKKFNQTWKPFCSNILGNQIIPLEISKQGTMPTTLQVLRDALTWPTGFI